MKWIALAEGLKTVSWEGMATSVRRRRESSTGLKLLAIVLKLPFGNTSSAVCPRARQEVEGRVLLRRVKAGAQPVVLLEKFARSETFHDAHRALAARTRMAGCSGSPGGESRQGDIQ